MQNNKTKSSTIKKSRRTHEQVGALILIVGTLVGIVAVSNQARKVLGELALRPAFAIIEHNGKENETARHPVRLDDALRAPTVGGF